MSSLNPFDSATTASMDPFWNMEMMLGNNMGYPGATNTQLGFPTTRGGNQVGFSNPGTPQIGMDLTEEADKWVVHADLPGFKDEDVELTIENGMLGVRATRDKTVESDTGITHRVEVNSYVCYYLLIISFHQHLLYANSAALVRCVAPFVCLRELTRTARKLISPMEYSALISPSLRLRMWVRKFLWWILIKGLLLPPKAKKRWSSVVCPRYLHENHTGTFFALVNTKTDVLPHHRPTWACCSYFIMYHKKSIDLAFCFPNSFKYFPFR